LESNGTITGRWLDGVESGDCDCELFSKNKMCIFSF
jgi:hypothetical protein